MVTAAVVGGAQTRSDTCLRKSVLVGDGRVESLCCVLEGNRRVRHELVNSVDLFDEC